MKVVTEDYRAAQLSPNNVGVCRVYYKKRYWDESDGAYVFESSWSELNRNEMASVSPVTWQLDSDILNEFKVSNLTLSVRNYDNRWAFDNPAGFFKQDAVSGSWVYEPYWMKFQVRAGYMLADGSEEVVVLFTGVATEYLFDASNKTVQISIKGLETTLQNSKAEGIATVVTEENAGTGDASETEFITLNPGVGGVTLVSVNGITKTEGSDYTLTDLNDETLGAKVTFSVAPSVGHTIRISYFYWPQDLQIHQLVEALLDSAGVLSYTVDPVVFDRDVLNTHVYTTQVDWDAGTKSKIDTNTVPGSIRVDWAQHTTARTWSTALTGWTEDSSIDPGQWSSDGTYLTKRDNVGAATDTALQRTSTALSGKWSFKFTFNNTNTGNQWSVVFAAPSVGFFNPGYVLQFHNTGAYGGSVGRYLALKNGNGVDVYGFAASSIDTSEHTVDIVKTGSGRFLVYYDSVLMIDVTDTSITSSNVFQLSASVAGASPTCKFRDFYSPDDEVVSEWTTAAIDAGSTPSAWAALINEEDGLGDIQYYTNTSADNVSYDGFVEASIALLPQSTRRRYIKLKVKLTADATINEEPTVGLTTLRYTTSTVAIILTEFAGQSVYEALQLVAEFANYEFGFTPDEEFFFRARSPGASVIEINQSNFIKAITSMDSGYERLYGAVRAVYGSITKEITDDGLYPQSPRARVVDKRFEISPSTSIRFPATADIASGVAANLFAYFTQRRKRLKIVTKFMPEIDLGDTVTVTFDDNSDFVFWHLGDTTVYHGQEDIHHFGDAEQFVHDLDARVIGVRYDVNNMACEFDLEEVIT